jgi:hypothetical protein
MNDPVALYRRPVGTPAPAGHGLSQADRDLCRRVGVNPDRIAAMTDETSYKEWLALRERHPDEGPTFGGRAA